jgi:motility quorum-sensing regulator / GCU-specific mRNA interferase toxin
MSKRAPRYPLSEVQALVRQGTFQVTASAARTASDLEFGRPDIVRCVLALSASDFYKSMPAERAQGLWQDVYRPLFEGVELYVKVQIRGDRMAVVISFKER